MRLLTQRIEDLHEELDNLDNTPIGNGAGELSEQEKQTEREILLAELAELNDYYNTSV